jgi:hypothetical protein
VTGLMVVIGEVKLYDCAQRSWYLLGGRDRGLQQSGILKVGTICRSSRGRPRDPFHCSQT